MRKTLFTTDLRANVATRGVSLSALPLVVSGMTLALPPETYDPSFRGQRLHTIYFDTERLVLRKARLKKDSYLTLRLRAYRSGGSSSFALSAKTESNKYRQPVTPDVAMDILQGNLAALPSLLSPLMLVRLLDLVGHLDDLMGVANIHCRRYAVEDDTDRMTLDVNVHTTTGKVLPYSVLEFKSSRPDDAVEPDFMRDSLLVPLKISKFLWATEV